MPVYEYACKSCGHHLEVSQSFSDAPLTTCPVCGGSLRKVFSSVGIMFKGSGFYRTDSRLPSGGAKDGKEGKEGKEGKDGAKEAAKEAVGAEKPAGEKSAAGGEAASRSVEKKAETTGPAPAKATKTGDVAKSA